MNVTILTGPSGSGNTSAKYVFEELGYYVVDNPPLNTTSTIVSALMKHPYKQVNVCVVVNIVFALQIIKELQERSDITLTLVLLNTDKDEIVKRYTLTRHIHPRMLMENISLEQAIEEDLEAAIKLTPLADIYIDTTTLTIKELRTNLYARIDARDHNTTSIQFTSFGLKNGLPIDIDLLIDTRVLPNPFWIEDLKSLTGMDKTVIEYLESFPQTEEFINKTIEYLEYALDKIVKQERASYNVGVCCSGGQHRSTYVANRLAKHFSEKYDVIVRHRDAYRLETRVPNKNGK